MSYTIDRTLHDNRAVFDFRTNLSFSPMYIQLPSSAVNEQLVNLTSHARVGPGFGKDGTKLPFPIRLHDMDRDTFTFYLYFIRFFYVGVFVCPFMFALFLISFASLYSLL